MKLKYSFLLGTTLLLFFILTGCTDYKFLAAADREKDVLLSTSKGDIVLRLYDETPLHRDNFLRLVKNKNYDGVLFHRVIYQFMIQSGDPKSRKNVAPGQPLGEGDLGYTVPAEFIPTLFHKKGTLAAAREGDVANPKKASSASQFYIVQGKVFTPLQLDSLEIKRLKGKKISDAARVAYTTVGGTPHLDMNYTVFGMVVKGLWVVDSIATTPTSKGKDRDRPLKDIKIKKATLIKRKAY